MQTSRYFCVIILCLGVLACSNRQVYTAIQQNRQHDCQKYQPPQYEACLEQYRTSYEDYVRQRQEQH